MHIKFICIMGTILTHVTQWLKHLLDVSWMLGGFCN